MRWHDGDRGLGMNMDYSGTGWIVMLLLLVVVAVGLAVLVAVLLRPAPPRLPDTRPGSGDGTQPAPPAGQAALSILEQRFASGEIDEEEFRRRRAALAENAPAPGP